MNVLILEDEIPAFEKLHDILGEFFKPDFKYDWARSIKEAKNHFQKRTKYDLIFSDIRLLDGTAFELFDAIQLSCPIIFCTAYNDYLLDAFQSNGIAYILKPYDQNDIQKALQKYDTLFDINEIQHNYPELFQKLEEKIDQQSKQYRGRFVVNKTNGIHLLKTSEVSGIEAAGDFCKIYSKDGKIQAVSFNIGTLIKTLDPKYFFRINRSQIVHIDAIENIEKHFKNRLVLQLKGVQGKWMTSTSATANFRKWLER